jgi:hypothetical protein
MKPYLSVELLDRERPLRLEIAGYDKEEGEFDGEIKENIVLSFHDTDKKLRLSNTNGDILVEAYGDDMDSWVGKGVELFVRPFKFKGKMMDIVGLRPAKSVRPAKSDPPRAAHKDSEIPF